MELPQILPAKQSTPEYAQLDPGKNKKKKLIIFACVFAAVAIIAILVGIIASASQPRKAVPAGKRTASSAQAGAPTSAIDPNTGKPLPAISGPSDAIKNSSESDADYADIPKPPTPTQDLTYLSFYNTPTPTPLATYSAQFFIPNGQQNNLTLRIWQYADGDQFDDIQLINTATAEMRIIGQVVHNLPGDSKFFTRDFSSVIFIGGKVDQFDYDFISFYSIPLDRMYKQFAPADIKKALPGFSVVPYSVFYSMYMSPDGTHIAFNYGKPSSSIAPNTEILVMNTKTYAMHVLKIQGQVQGWKDDNTIQYLINTDPNTVQTLESPISNILY